MVDRLKLLRDAWVVIRSVSQNVYSCAEYAISWWINVVSDSAVLLKQDVITYLETRSYCISLFTDKQYSSWLAFSNQITGRR